jgi:hypothetical protein
MENMKNVLIYVNPTHAFNPETEVLAKIQIDNSLALGWYPEDIMLLTNFEYVYNAIRAEVIPDQCFCENKPLGTKTTAVAYLLDHGYFKDDLYWVHDFDAYQMNLFSEKELDVRELGLTDYGWSRRWCMGSYFFRPSSAAIFRWINEVIKLDDLIDEKALLQLTRMNYQNINDRIQRLNITYNFGMRNVPYNLRTVHYPIKVVHFHPHHKEIDTMKLFRPIMTDLLKQIFAQHKII